ncbi:uncharacterized protein LOC122265017 [Penaeus japonicus]|uniref:uncharacterized protein LOC122265017 n=1 Tax=Penaeus japonicus TaxID=27405 RepID=UPI001C711600|nr:uncharacterized protein LOC122265017 [Penaeus japonicus]
MTMLIISGLTLYMLYSMITQHMNHITNKIFPSDTQSANDTQVAGIPDSWLEVWDPPDFVGSDGADVDAFVYKVRVEGDWPVVLGTYEHYKDENFAEYLKASGIPAFMVSIILSTVPIVTIKKIPADSDYYYDIDYNNVKDRDNVYGDLAEEDSTAFQMLIKTETWIRDIEMRFQLGQAFHHIEPDESESQNTFWFAEPRVLLQDKTRVADRHRIIYQFGPEGYNTTLVDLSRNITAKRHFRRTQPETQEEKKLRTSMVTATENGMTTLEEESNVTLSEGVIGADGERFINDTQMLSSERKEIVLEAGNITVGDGLAMTGGRILKKTTL